METWEGIGISKILKYKHICAFNMCLEVSDQLCRRSSEEPAVSIRTSSQTCFQEISFLTFAATFPGVVQLVINTASKDSFSSDLCLNRQLRDSVASYAESVFGQVARPRDQLRGVYKDHTLRK